MTTIDYGFETTDDVKYDQQGLPVGTYKVMVVGEEEWKDKNTGIDTGVVVQYEILSGDKKGMTRKYWYLTKHAGEVTANIAKQNIKRIADATGKAVNAMNPLKNRVFVITVAPQKNDPDRTEIKKYWPESYEAEAEIPD